MSEQLITPPDTHDPVETRRVIGAFIAAVGVAVLVLVVALIRSKWFADKPATYSPFWVLAPVVAAIVALFLIINERPAAAPLPTAAPVGTPPPPPSAAPLDHWEQDRARERRELMRQREAAPVRARRLLLQVLTGVAVLLAILGTLDLGRQARRSQVYDQFALTLPLGDASTPQTQAMSATDLVSLQKGSSVVSGAQSSASTSSPNAAAQALFVWWVARERKPVPEGALAMLMGGLFICAFGIWFPRLNLGETGSAIGLSEKLVAPVLSFALVALGATQQADAAKDDRNMELATRGLPAVIGLSREELASKTVERQERLYTFQSTDLSPDAVKYLEAKLEGVAGRVDQNDTAQRSLTGVVNEVNGRLIQVQEALRHPQPPSQQVTAKDVAAIRGALADLDRQAGVSLESTAAERAGGCLLLGLELKALPDQIKALDTQATAKDQARKQFYSQHFWLRLGQPAPDSGDLDRQKAAELKNNGAAATRRQNALCSAVPQATAQ